MNDDASAQKTGLRKITDATIGLAAFSAAMMTGQVTVKFDPSKDLSLAAVSVSVEMPRASASCSSNGKGSGCVC
jgi:hypothetical protein